MIDESETLSGGRVDLDAVPVVVAVDPAKVERVVENLLTNAIKHTPEGTSVQLRVRPRDEGVLISVDDEGPGVPDDLKQAVFEPFLRGPEPRSPGTGIGLALVARFAELHGGKAWVEDRPGGGASFRVWLPGTRLAESQLGPEPRREAAGVTAAAARDRTEPLASH